ncbi:MAG: leucine-rich repeat protein [Bacteroidales bacterium]|nr:leucine-rich repeat protein [Bacteroidales bacterium]
MKKKLVYAAAIILATATVFSSCKKDKEDEIPQQEKTEESQKTDDSQKTEEQQKNDDSQKTDEQQKTDDSQKTDVGTKPQETTKVKITFDLNGFEGTAPAAIETEKNKEVTLPKPTTNSKFKFMGWSKEKNGTVIKDFKFDKDVTLYAIFSTEVKCKLDDIEKYLAEYSKLNKKEKLNFEITDKCGLTENVETPYLTNGESKDYQEWANKNLSKINLSAIFEKLNKSLDKYPNVPLVLDFTNSGLKYLPANMLSNLKNTGATIEIKLPKTLEFLYQTFQGCKRIKSITIPASVKVIAGAAFQTCTNLQTVIFEGNSQLENITTEAFFQSGITSIKIPKNVKKIGNQAFYECNNLNKLTFENESQLETIEVQAFCGDEKITAVTLPAKVKTIKNEAFARTGLKSVTLPKSATDVAENAFPTGCKKNK